MVGLGRFPTVRVLRGVKVGYYGFLVLVIWGAKWFGIGEIRLELGFGFESVPRLIKKKKKEITNGDYGKRNSFIQLGALK